MNKKCPICKKKFQHHLRNAKYCSKACREEGEARKAAFLKTHKRCSWCGEYRDKETEYPENRQTGRNSGKMPVCVHCMPFTVRFDQSVPICGVFERKGSRMAFKPICPLVDNCRERMLLGLDPACMAPDRRTLTIFYLLGKAEQRQARMLYKVRLDDGGNVVPDSIDRYLEYYVELGEKQGLEVMV